jgi:hypothetical protein
MNHLRGAVLAAILLAGFTLAAFGAELWSDDPHQYVEVELSKRLFNQGKIFTSFKPQKTRLLSLLKDRPEVKATELSRYGGRLDKRTEATGFFHTKKIDGRWWLVDPDGYPFYVAALNSIRPGATESGKTSLPKTFDEKWKDVGGWAEATTQWLRTNGFTAASAWSDDSLQQVQRPLPYLKIIYLMYGFGSRFGAINGSNNMAFPNNCIPVFHPDFEAYCAEQIKKEITDAMRRDPLLIGYFVDNELPWKENALQLYLDLPAQDPNRKFAVDWLRKRKDVPPASELSAEQLKALIQPPDSDAFLELCAKTYFSVVARVLKAADSNHLYLGSRLHGQAVHLEPVFRGEAPYVDVISVNYYNRWTPKTDELEDWAKWTDKPFIISEWYVKGEDTGYKNENGAGGVVHTQKERGEFYQNFTLGLLESKSCVGWCWHTYKDSYAPPQDSNKGFLNYDFEPYAPLVDMARDINRQTYALIDYFDRENR